MTFASSMVGSDMCKSHYLAMNGVATPVNRLWAALHVRSIQSPSTVQIIVGSKGLVAGNSRRQRDKDPKKLFVRVVS